MNEQNLGKRIVKNSFWGFTATLISRFGALFFTIFIARMLMPERYGIFSIAMSIGLFFYIFADIGINASAVRFISAALNNDKKRIGAYYKYLLKIKIMLSITFFILLILLAYPISNYVFDNPDLFIPLMAASFYIFVLSFEVFHNQLFYTIEKAQFISLRETLVQLLKIIFAAVIFWFVAVKYQILGIFLGLALIHLIALIIILLYFKKNFPELFIRRPDHIDKKNVLRFVKFLTISSISSVFFMNVDSIMLGIFLGASLVEYVGFYKAAFSMVIGITTLLAAPNMVLLPIFTKISKEETVKVFDKVLRFVILLSIPSSFGILILGEYFIKLFFGAPFAQAAAPLSILGFTILPIVSLSILLQLYSGNKRPEVFAKIIFTVSIFNVILNYFFIKFFLKISPEMAINVAAIATLISWILYFLIALNHFRKDFKNKLPYTSLVTSLLASVIMYISLRYFLGFFEVITLPIAMATILIGIIVYSAALLLLGELGKEDLLVTKLLLSKS